MHLWILEAKLLFCKNCEWTPVPHLNPGPGVYHTRKAAREAAKTMTRTHPLNNARDKGTYLVKYRAMKYLRMEDPQVNIVVRG